MKNKDAEQLLQKYLRGEASEAEQALVEQWFNKLDVSDQFNVSTALKDKQLAEIRAQLPGYPQPGKMVRLWPHIAAAASVILCLAAGLFFYRQRQQTPDKAQLAQTAIRPGGNKAYLILGNGQRITLTNAPNGQLAHQSGITITKSANGLIVYSIANAAGHTAGPDESNTIETPKGGQYEVQLPDGTAVWLNAASSLTYPVSFAAQKQRKVTLTGEAYFEVAKDQAHPFVVNSARQRVTVLGTHFNINSYTEDAVVKTTLFEGSVKVSSNKARNMQLLKPGQQAQLTGGGIQVESHPDLEEVIAWKNGYFKFHESLESILSKVARWYDVEVVYQGNVNRARAYGAKISRTKDLSTLLKIIESTGTVHFKIEERRVIVME